MSWIQENKFTAALAGATLVGSAALLYLSIQQSGNAKDFDSKKSKMLTAETKLKNGVPYPNEENMELKQENVRNFYDDAVELQEKLVAYRPEKLEDFSPTQFGAQLNSYRDTLNKAFEASEGVVPAGTSYGFKDYASKQPTEKATAELKYQLDAFQWLFTSLAETGDVELIKVLRNEIAAEGAEASSNGRHGRNGKAAASQDKSVYEAQGLEVAFRGTETQLEQFLESVANGDKYFFAIRDLRVINEQTGAPSAKVKFDTPAPAAGGGFGDFDTNNAGGFLEAVPAEGDAAGDADAAVGGDAAEELIQEPAVDPSADDTRILKPILGDEKVNVLLKMELLIFKSKDEVKIPGKGNKQGGDAAETDSEESETE